MVRPRLPPEVGAIGDHILRFPTCAFVGLAKSRIAALSKPGAAVSPVNKFDGIWIVKEICEKKAPTWPADSFQFAGRIKDGIFHYQYGEEGKPGSAIYDGKIEADGTWIKNQRSWFVSRTRPGSLRLTTIN